MQRIVLVNFLVLAVGSSSGDPVHPKDVLLALNQAIFMARVMFHLFKLKAFQRYSCHMRSYIVLLKCVSISLNEGYDMWIQDLVQIALTRKIFFDQMKVWFTSVCNTSPNMNTSVTVSLDDALRKISFSFSHVTLTLPVFC